MPDEEQPGSYEARVYADSVEVALEISCGSDPSSPVGPFVAQNAQDCV